jgi:hypothetical protein
LIVHYILEWVFLKIAIGLVSRVSYVAKKALVRVRFLANSIMCFIEKILKKYLEAPKLKMAAQFNGRHNKAKKN